MKVFDPEIARSYDILTLGKTIHNSKFITVEISALQKIVRERYFKTDNERGIYHTALWFHEEVGELSAAIASGDNQNAKEELGDVLMWLLTLANLLNVDMEDVIKEYLNNPRKLPSK